MIWTSLCAVSLNENGGTDKRAQLLVRHSEETE
ncbi:hypothetical protein SRABI121_01765 [Microbacterium sp. Bi121]|nr:hypothetical protein SRABI121_01765 [Microbacterium sp. Bi121]